MRTRNIDQLDDDLHRAGTEIARAVNRTIPQLVGEMLVEGFQKSFDLRRFNDTGSAPWKQVKRRTEGSPWYGFNYRSNYAVPEGSRGSTATGRPRRYGTRGGITNFTPTATTRSILLGWGSANLRGSIYLHTANRGRVIVASDQPHAQVHNEGEEAQIFGRKTFRMPKRQFMGHSSRLDAEAKEIIDTVITRIIER